MLTGVWLDKRAARRRAETGGDAMTTPDPPNDHDIPRRQNLGTLTSVEIEILKVIDLVESLPADPRLTDAVVLLDAARQSVADYVDGIEQRRHVVVSSGLDGVHSWR